MYPPAVKHGLLVNLPFRVDFSQLRPSIYQGFSNFFPGFSDVFPTIHRNFPAVDDTVGAPGVLLGVGMNFAAVVSGIFGALENIWEDI